MADKKAVVKNADMSEDMQQDSIDISTQAMEKFNIEKDIAAFTKKLWRPTFIWTTSSLKLPTWMLVVFWYFYA